MAPIRKLLPTFTTPRPYKCTVEYPPCPRDVSAHDYNPTWVKLTLTCKRKVLLTANVSISNLGQVQPEVDKAVANDVALRKYNRSLAGIWNNYPVNWVWQFIQRQGFVYVAGGRSETHLTHHFTKKLASQKGVLIRFKTHVDGGFAIPKIVVKNDYGELMANIEAGRYE